ncbi:winged helix-turn-helix domain-containing protein [Actinotalea sp. K2]|uniref:winged helix-turn-helix domain-containing protein n=1 Tax=Actinotalea sp. K2 TaxID=2939438 RepID=UPI0020177FEE|nr:crosslink repair DNA glycosylase YcaQ family protein [Actinotalea sp. K2]MCL3862666.1 winged helix DNA-binding domain-containing protein [Actinotalea sp. K2]
MPSSRPVDLSMSQARRVALRAQGLDRRRPVIDVVTMRQLQQVIDRVGLLQIDSVNVLARAHLVPTFSRVGPYDTALLDRAAGSPPRRLVECSAHEATYVPPSTYRLQGWRQRAYLDHAWGTVREVPLRYSEVVEDVRALVRERGPVTGREVHAVFEAEHPRERTGWGWNWTVAKRVLEFLFFTGEITSARRNAAFERCYDLTERVLPAAVLASPEPAEPDAVRALIEIGARAQGVGTVGCFADYFRLGSGRARRAVEELVEDGVLSPVRVRGWDRPTYLHRDATLPRRALGSALLSPFDPLVFTRPRLEELFGTRYRIEIYVPAAQRVHGYYVLPFLLGERIAARVDLKAERAGAVLKVQAAHLEHVSDPARRPTGEVASELAAELGLMASWLGLEQVRLADDAHGDLVASLAAALGPGSVPVAAPGSVP